MLPHEIRKVRESMGLSRRAFAPLVNRSWRSIQAYELGRSKVPVDVHAMASKLARAQMYRLAGLEPPPDPQPVVEQGIGPKPSKGFLARLRALLWAISY